MLSCISELPGWYHNDLMVRYRTYHCSYHHIYNRTDVNLSPGSTTLAELCLVNVNHNKRVYMLKLLL